MVSDGVESFCEVQPATSLYALKTLKAHGLQGRALWDVTHATLVSQITYASPSWRGFIKAEETARLNVILSKDAVLATSLLISNLYMIYWMLVMSHFLRPPDIILNTFCINSSHHLNRSVTISLPVAMASPSLPYPQSSCAKTFCTVCCTMIYINVKTCVIFFADIVVYTVCFLC